MAARQNLGGGLGMSLNKQPLLKIRIPPPADSQEGDVPLSPL